MANYNSQSPHPSDTISKMFPTSHRGSHCYGKSWAKIKVVQRSSQASVETWWSRTSLKGLIYLPVPYFITFLVLPLPVLPKPPATGQDNERLLSEEMRQGMWKKINKEKKGLFSLGSRLKMEHISTFDSKQNSTCVNELSHTLGSAEQEKGDLWFLLLTLLLHAAQAKLIYGAIHAGLK